MSYSDEQVRAAEVCIRDAVSHIAKGANEDVVRQSFASRLRSLFPDDPSWIHRHISGGEAAVKVAKGDRVGTGFVDNLVDLTAIEYESDITNPAKFTTGLRQVKEYCASLIRSGHPVDTVLGVLSDTVRWRVYGASLAEDVSPAAASVENVELTEFDQIDTTPNDRTAAISLLTFLEKYLGRKGARPLSALSLAEDLGFGGPYGARHLSDLLAIVRAALEERPKYAKLVASLWTRFVHAFQEQGAAGSFEISEYRDELYVLTLAKLVCANVLSRVGLLSSESELRTILDGDFFRARGLMNLVEYDFFGWLTDDPFLGRIMPIAQSMQQDLQAYDFGQVPSEDLFGQTMAQLARRTRRLLLGQEWTPHWLARRMVKNVLSQVPPGQRPQLIDMCCGSGAMIVEAVLAAKPRIEADIPAEERQQRLTALTQTITGFDIDPLAVMLAKANWVLAASGWLEPYGVYPVTIPVFHADSLFAIVPLAEGLDADENSETYTLKIATETVLLPKALVSPEFQASFDALLDLGYGLVYPTSPHPPVITSGDISDQVNAILHMADNNPNDELIKQAAAFVCSFATTVDKLTRTDQNGIWAFILRNSYRPGLVAGRFNGLVSNPPWLALSKIASNPYKQVLELKAQAFGIAPPGPAFLHTEMATVFLLHAVDRYLHDGGAVACIVPDTILNGYHHNPFRQSKFMAAKRSVNFNLREIWKIDVNTFKNRAVVLIGRKGGGVPGQPNPIPALHVSPTETQSLSFQRLVQGNRTAWSDQPVAANSTGFFQCAQFDQGVDVMPRTVFFHQFQRLPNRRGDVVWRATPIDTIASAIGFATRDAKECKEFRLPATVVPDEFVFRVLISNLLTPFKITAPLQALLPIVRADSSWRPLTGVEVVAKGGAAVVQAFQSMGSTLQPNGYIPALWERLNTRNKLVRQKVPDVGFLVVCGTSGERVCAAYFSAGAVDSDKLVIDQTLNWTHVETEEEALYLVGALNSQAVSEVIFDFQPEGKFGKRHIHSLPYRATPPYDTSQALHQEVVAATTSLIAEYAALLRTSPQFQNVLNPNVSTLASRRKRLSTAIADLPSFAAYTAVCRALYGLP